MQWRPILAPVAEKLDALMATAERQTADDATREHVHVLRLTHDPMLNFRAMEVATADPEDMGVLYGWNRPGVVSGWKPIGITLYWELQGYKAKDFQQETWFGDCGVGALACIVCR